MSSEKTTQPRGLDAFQVKVLEFLAGIAQNPKPMLGVVGLVLVALVAGYGIRYFASHKSDNRRVELSKVDQVYDDELTKIQKQREELEKKRDTLRAALPSPASPEAVPPTSPEIAALDTQIAALKPDHKGSADQYKAFYEKYPKNAEGLLAGLKYAAFSAEQKQLEEAQKVLEAIIKESASYSIVHTQSLLLLISVLTDRDQLDKALEYSDTFVKAATGELKPRALLGKGQIQFLKKDYANAQTTLNQVINEHGNSMEAERARSLLALVPQQG
jgi:predicted negative regulator of RcsB-dependent stress response